MQERTRGVAMACAAHLLWGLFPLYFHHLGHVPATDVIAHRAGWSFLVLAVGFAFLGRGPWQGVRFDLRLWSGHFLSSILIATNWLVYVWGVGAGRVVECSLGYFINPLVSVLLGVVVLGERLRRLQWAALALVVAAVVWLGFAYGAVPWLSLALALSFGGYGLARKTSRLASAPGLLVETGLLFPLALAWLAWGPSSAGGSWFGATPTTQVLLALTGVVTTIPLLLFASAARRIPLSVVGFVQYLTPTLQFLLGVLYFREDFPPSRLVGFALVWAGLGLLAIESLRHGNQQRKRGRDPVVLPKLEEFLS